MNKKNALLLLLMAGTLSACAMFPGFFINEANNILGIGSWQHTDNFVSPEFTRAIFDYKAFDMTIDSDGDVLLAYVRNVGSFPVDIWEYTSGQGFSMLSMQTNNLLEGVMRLSVGYDPIPDPHEPVLVCYDGNTNGAHVYMGTGWQLPIYYSKKTPYFKLEQGNGYLSYFDLETNGNLRITTNYNYPTGVFPYLLTTASELFLNYNPDVAGLQTYGFTIDNFGILYPYARQGFNWYDYTSITNGKYSNPTNFRALYIGADTNNYYLFEDGVNGGVVLERVGNFISTNLVILNQYSNAIKGLDMDFDWSSRNLYFAVADYNGAIHVYKYNINGNTAATPLGGGIPSADAKYIILKVLNNHIYLAFVRMDGIVEVWDYQD